MIGHVASYCYSSNGLFRRQIVSEMHPVDAAIITGLSQQFRRVTGDVAILSASKSYAHLCSFAQCSNVDLRRFHLLV